MDSIFDVYERTKNNIRFYQREGDEKLLLNEIGCLRGVVYSLGILLGCEDYVPEDKELLYFIDIQNKLLEESKKKTFHIK